MDKKHLRKKLDRIKNRLFKCLVIYEEDNYIQSTKRKTPPKVNSDDVPHPLPYAEYVEDLASFIEGLILGLDEIRDENTISILVGIKINLLSITYHKGDKDAYKDVKQKLFNGMKTIQDLMDIL